MHKILFIHVGLLVSCSTSTNRVSEIDNLTKEKTIYSIGSLLKSCIPQHDTLINSTTSIQYVIIDTFYTVKVKVGGIDTLLNYQFNCKVPRGLIPSFHSYYGNSICLIKGSGQHYREFIIAYAEGKTVILKNFQIALATDLKKSMVIYQNYNNPQEIILENISSASKRVFTLPANYVNSTILSATIKDKRLDINFLNSSVFFNL